MPRKATASNVTVFVDKIYDFELQSGVVRWLSDENGRTGRRCMPLASFRKVFARMEKMLREVDNSNVVAFPTERGSTPVPVCKVVITQPPHIVWGEHGFFHITDRDGDTSIERLMSPTTMLACGEAKRRAFAEWERKRSR